MILNLSLLETQVEYALENHELSSLAAYAYGLCQKFNHYYHLFPVLAEKDPAVRSLRLRLVLLFKGKVEKLLACPGDRHTRTNVRRPDDPGRKPFQEIRQRAGGQRYLVPRWRRERSGASSAPTAPARPPPCAS